MSTNKLQSQNIRDEVTRGIRSAESYTGKAVLTMILYYLGFFIIGLVVNIVFLLDANKNRDMTGRPPDGRGCLVALLVVHLVLPVLAILLLVFGVFSLAIIGA